MAFVRQRFIKGNLAFWQDSHQKRLVDAIGPDVVKYIDDYVDGPATDAGFDACTDWTITRVEAGGGESTITRGDAVGGQLLLTTDANEDDGISMQLVGTSFELTTGQHLYCGFFGIQVSEATQSDFFLGLAVTDTAILGGVTDRIGFQKLDGSTDVKFMVEKDSTETLSSAIHTAVAATAFDLEFYWDGDTSELMYFVNGTFVASSAITNLPDDEPLRLSLEFLAGSANVRTLKIDKVSVIQIGR